MKTAIAIIALAVGIVSLMFSISANALTYYDAPGHAFPDEMSPIGLPQAIPCASRQTTSGDTGYECIWLSSTRVISEWLPEEQREVRYYNQQTGNCKRGTCIAGGIQVGGIPQDTSYMKISIWYYVWPSTDGKVVAYLTKTGPAYGGKDVSYTEAAKILHQFYLDSGMTDAEIAHEMERRVDGGLAVALSGGIVKKTSISGEIKEAWCNPRADDECSINGQKVPMDQLKNFLPVVDQEKVQNAGGVCDIPICYDSNDKPVGVIY